MDFRKVLLVSDVDGTLIGRNFKIPERNVLAIKLFQKAGGRFSIASGRSAASVLPYAQQLEVNTPCVLVNGTLLYDYSCGCALWRQALTRADVEYYVNLFLHRYPSLGVEAYLEDGIVVIKRNEYVSRHLAHEQLAALERPMLLPQENGLKLLFCAQPAVKTELEAFAKTVLRPGVRFVSSSDHYLELLPANADKGTALNQLSRLCGVRAEFVVAVGDYYNDLEMFKAAGVSAAPLNAPKEIQQLVSFTVCPCEEGAVAEVIDRIASL